MKAPTVVGLSKIKETGSLSKTHFLNIASHGPLKVTTKAGSPSYTNSIYYAPVESPHLIIPSGKKKKKERR